MRKINVIFISLLVLIIINACQEKLIIQDLIEPIKLTAGNKDSVVINDLYYADNYNITFKENENVNIERKDNIIYLQPDSSFEGMTLLEFEADMNIYHIPVISNKEKYYEFSFKPDKEYDKLTLFGSFNGWNRTNLPMTDEDGDGTFEASVALDPGVYQYKFFGDGEEIVDPLNPNKISNGMGSFNSIRTIDDPNSAKFYLHIDEYYSKNPQSTFSFYFEDELGGELSTNHIFALLDNTKISEDKINLDGKYISINFNYDELENQTLRVAASKNGRVSNIQTVKLENGKPIGNSSFTWNDAIIYSLND